jgi:fumarylacetoacetase
MAVDAGLNETHDPSLRSFVEAANAPGADFPLQNLPFGVFARRAEREHARVGVAIGDRVVDMRGAFESGLLEGEARSAGEACTGGALNRLMALGPREWSAIRLRLSRMLRVGGDAEARTRLERHMVPMAGIEMLMPAEVGDYTDFYASIHHATNVGRLFRPDSPLLPNYKYIPIGYHGRSSSIVVSGSAVHRPLGQSKEEAAEAPTFGPSRRLDYELEVGCFVGPGNPLGTPVRIDQAERHLFGLCLVNDWSARDVQQWEYQPLGPFLSKSFATSVSPWIVTLEALAPFRAGAFERPEGDPAPLPHLDSPGNREAGGIDVTLEVRLLSAAMKAQGLSPARLSRASFASMYWTIAQLVAHHSSNGCNLRPGDLLASGTVSGPTYDSRGCLLELTRRGADPIELPSGEKRRFLEDGDEVILRGWCERDGFARIGFGECRGTIVGAQAGPFPA